MNNPDVDGQKDTVRRNLEKITRSAIEHLVATAQQVFSRDVVCRFAHPINELDGLKAMIEKFWVPLKTACPDLERRDDIIIGGRSARGDWVATTGYYYGTLTSDWLGIPATQNWIAIRYGDFYRVAAGRIVEVYSIIDFVDLMRQAGIKPLPPALGIESLVPPPALQDGISRQRADEAESLRTRRLVEAMIFDGLLQFDGKSSASIGMERYWHPDMMWFGPGGIGTTRGLDGFLKYHQEPFQNAFPDWKGEIPMAVVEGNFMAAGGWPSIHCTHSGAPWLGVQSSGRRLTMRVMDWWRRDGDWLKENWIFIDVAHVLLQLDVDLFAADKLR